MADTDDFCIVTGKKARKVRKTLNQSIPPLQTSKEHEYFHLQEFKKRLDSCIKEIIVSQFFYSSYDSILSAIPLQTKRLSADKDLSAYLEPQNNLCSNSESNKKIHVDSDLTCTDPENNRKNRYLHHTNRPDNLEDHLETLSLSSEEHPDVHLLSYGIGNFISCLIARYQLAFLLALRSQLGERCTECLVYDPVFSSQEKLVLQTYGCQIIPQNEEGKRECTVPTIAFLPHCGKALYNNLLWRNLTTHSSEGLSLLVLVGNSFSNIIERTPKRVLNKTGNYILKLSPYMTEVSLANTFTHKDVFNDLSIHYFAKDRLQTAQWSNLVLEEPIYDDKDAEFIGK